MEDIPLTKASILYNDMREKTVCYNSKSKASNTETVRGDFTGLALYYLCFHYIFATVWVVKSIARSSDMICKRTLYIFACSFS